MKIISKKIYNTRLIVNTSKKCLFVLLTMTHVHAHTDPEAIFTYIYQTNGFHADSTASGPGSTLEQTEVLRTQLRSLCVKYTITSIMDAPCGDFHWMQKLTMNGISYIGLDIVKDLILKNQQQYATSSVQFYDRNVITDPLPKVDLIICRDLFIHLPNAAIKETIRNFKRSKSKYLLTSSFARTNGVNKDIKMGGLRLINLLLPPFNLPRPLDVIHEHSTEDSPFFGVLNDKYMVLWALEDINL